MFSTLQIYDLITTMTEEGAGGIVGAAVILIQKRIRKLIAWARAGEVAVQLRHARIEDATSEVRARGPASISWSNVLDYFEPAEFHAVARACTAHGDAIHSGYSTNWPTIVMGTCLLDYHDAKMREKLIDCASTSTEQAHHGLGWSSLFRSPPPCNPLNTTGYVLEMGFYKKWVEFWFGVAKRTGHCGVGNAEHAMINPLSMQGTSSLLFTWTYDSTVKLNPLTPPDP